MVPASGNHEIEYQDYRWVGDQLASFLQQCLGVLRSPHPTPVQLGDASVGYRVSCTAKAHEQAELFHASGYSSEHGTFVYLQSLGFATSDGQSRLPCMVLCN